MVLWLDRDKTIPVDLTGIHVEPKVGNLMMLVEVELPNIINLTMPASVSAYLSANTNWSLKLIKPGNEIQTICRGPVRVMADA